MIVEIYLLFLTEPTLDANNEHLRSCGNPEVDKLDYEHEVNIPNEFQDLF